MPTPLLLAGIGFKANFNNGFAGVSPVYAKLATLVTSANTAEEYGWLKDFPGIREWLGDRVVHGLAADGYRIRNRDFEMTVAVKKNDLDDDTLGIYAPMMAEVGRASATFPDRLVFELLKAGHKEKCSDGQPFFSANHPDGKKKRSNWLEGDGPLWALMDTSRALKPLIFQERKKFTLVAKTDPTDEAVFSRGEYVYGVDGRCNVGFGFWQMAYGSRQPLTVEAFETARAAMMSLTSENGAPLGLTPNLLVAAPAHEGAARRLLTSESLPNGESNPWKGAAELLISPWLAE